MQEVKQKPGLLRDRCHQQQWDEETAWAVSKVDYTWRLSMKPGPLIRLKWSQVGNNSGR